MDQLPGEQDATGLRDHAGRGADVLAEQPAKLALPDLQPLGQRRDVAPRCAPPAPPAAPPSSAPPSISLSARETVTDVPRQASRSGELSGRHRRHGRKPASCAAAAVRTKRQFASFGGLAGQIGRQ